MNRLAVFAEGSTEVQFIKNLIEEIAGKNKVLIEKWKIKGGVNIKKTIQYTHATQPANSQNYYVLIIDCGGDHQVKTRICEEHENFTKKGYVKIIGIRDVYPTFSFADIPKLEANLPKFIKTKLIPVEFILSIMEIESWFLAETSHFSKIDPAITIEAIKTKLGFDPEKDDMEKRLTPAADLNDCYAICGKKYDKTNVKRTINKLDYAKMYLHFCDKFEYFGRLVTSIDSFLGNES